MIQLYHTTEGNLVEVADFNTCSWVNVIDPSFEEREWINTHIPFVSEYLTDSLDIDEQSRVEKEDDYLLVVMRLPHFQGIENDKPFVTVPLIIIIAENIFITLCQKETVIIKDFLRERIKGFATDKKNKFLLQIMFKGASRFLLHLRNINKIVDKLEDELESSLQNKELMELLKYEKALIYYTTALKSNEAMMERLRRLRIFSSLEEDEELLEDVMIENRQAIEMTGITQQVLTQMMDAYASVINNNMNNIMKFLTMATICISIPTLLSSLYGMNVSLPGQNSNTSFLIIIFASVLMVGTVIMFFRKKRWF